MAYSMITLSGAESLIADEKVQALSTSLRGKLVTPESSSYDEVRAIWNAMIDRRPGLIACCAGAADVIRAVNFANEHNLLVAVRGAGHNIAGNAVCEGGLMIDLSGMKSVRVDLSNRTAHVEPGVTLGELDNETQAFGLATPVGINSTTGIAGLTLGGGFGWLSRKYGMTVDNLLAADVVTAKGELVRTSSENHPDLFWGIRGGGGNLGIVTSFEFQLHPVGPQVLSGLIFHPFAEAHSALEFYRDFTSQASDDLTVWVVLRKAPPLPFLPEEVHGTNILAFALLYSGKAEEGEKEVEALRNFGTPIADAVMLHDFCGFESAFDPLLEPGARNYWKSHNFRSLSNEWIDTVLKYGGSLPSAQSEIFIAQMGGAQSRIAPTETAYWPRDAAYVMNVHTRWEKVSDDDRCMAWAREFFDATAPHATGGVYVNFMPEDEPDRVSAAYGDNYERLVALKDKYDPTNLFRLNQNIQPRGIPKGS